MHPTRVFFLPLAALLAAGCGSAPQTRSPASRQQRAAAVRHERSPGQPAGTAAGAGAGSGSLIFLSRAHDGPPRPPRELYAVFRRPPRPADLEAQQRARGDAILDTVGDPGGLGASIGRPLYHDTRLVLGSVARGVYALPTTKGSVCIGALPSGGAGCGTPGPHGLTVDYDDVSGGLLLYGLVGDDVRRVDVVTGSSTRQAELGENGYRVELANGGSGQLRKLLLHLRGGSTEAVPLQP